MKYEYENLSEDQFENLAVHICQRLLGAGVQGFAKGPDGGKDAKFIGKAQLFPSTSAPWEGITIIQAKHTIGINRHFGDTDFYSPDSKSCVIVEELPRIKKLFEQKGMNHYILFSNRRLGSQIASKITSHISEFCGIEEGSIYLCGLEQLEVWLARWPEIAAELNIDPADMPLIINPDDLAEVVMALAENKDKFSEVADDPPTPRIPYEKKNEINKMDSDYADIFRKKFLKDTAEIQAFLAAPENNELQKTYESIVDEFQLKILSKRKDYQEFNHLIEHLLDLMYKRDAILNQRKHKRLTRAMLFYMYWNCDIGLEDNA